MATRSHIGVRNTDGTVDYIYCHWDGYPEHNGKILIDHYADMDKVNALMKLGNISILGPEIGEKHDFDSLIRNENWCRAYGRDREHADQQVKTIQFADLLKDDSVDYIYVFDGDYWECFDAGNLERDINLYNMFIHNTASDGI